jgi:hypothetical protein
VRAVALTLAGWIGFGMAALAAPCDRLASLAIPNTKITSAATMISGPDVLPGENTGLERSLPEFCKVDAVADSETKIEVWLPTEDQWNGRFLGTDTVAMESGLRQGYAIARVNNGDVHGMTETGAGIVLGFYRRSAEHSYFSGCGVGGNRALTEAERYPADYDGIVVGASKQMAIPDLREFRRRNGKLLVYEASADLVMPHKAIPGLFRIFVDPGLGHCAVGLGALDKWVSDGVAPETTLNRPAARRIK